MKEWGRGGPASGKKSLTMCSGSKGQDVAIPWTDPIGLEKKTWLRWKCENEG